MTELSVMIAAFVGLMLIGKIAIMGLDDRRSLMLRPVPVPASRERNGR